MTDDERREPGAPLADDHNGMAELEAERSAASSPGLIATLEAEHWHIIPGGIEFEDADGRYLHVLLDPALYSSLAERLASSPRLKPGDGCQVVFVKNHETAIIGPTSGSIRGSWDVIDTDGSVMCRWSTMAQAQAHADRANGELVALAALAEAVTTTDEAEGVALVEALDRDDADRGESIPES